MRAARNQNSEALGKQRFFPAGLNGLAGVFLFTDFSAIHADKSAFF